MKLNILCGDLFSVACDAYVNPTDVRLSGSGGLDRQIHLRAGRALEEECAALRDKMTEGCTRVTTGGDLPVKYVLHTACSKCAEEQNGSYDRLSSCYTAMLRQADLRKDIRHLAIPPVGTGVAGYSLISPCYANTDFSLTAVTMLSALLSCRLSNLETVTLVCSSREKYDALFRTYDWIRGKGLDKRERIHGSLLGGAIGDALGYPVEFDGAERARISEYILDEKTGKAVISDDTQMTLFTACGLLYGHTRWCGKGIGGELWNYIAFAYQDWLNTQQPDFLSNETKHDHPVSWIRSLPELNVCRAPGMTCLSALQAGGGSLEKPLNNSKGCGGVMRIAPIPLYIPLHTNLGKEYNMNACAQAAAITHGHLLGWLSAAALGNILYNIMNNLSLAYAVRDTVLMLRTHYAEYPDTERMIRLIEKAETLAKEAKQSKEKDLIKAFDITNSLGEGWVGEEALAVGLFCALACGEESFDACVCNAVGHKGDSDSTGSIAGQIWGAYYGVSAIPGKWFPDLELREVIEEIAEDLAGGCQVSEYGSHHDPEWIRKYVFCKEK